MDDPAVIRFLIPRGKTPRGILGALRRAGYGVETAPPVRAEDLILDTQEGRLARVHARVSLRRIEGSWRWRFEPPTGSVQGGAGSPPPASWPMATEGFPQTLQEAAGGKGFFPILRLRRVCVEGRIEAPAGTILWYIHETLSAAGPPYGGPWAALAQVLLAVRAAEGGEVELSHLAVYLRDRLGLSAEPADACALGLALLGRVEPGGQVPGSLEAGAGDTLVVAARKIVGQQALKMRANTEGTRLDLDPEYLHDLRVAARRLRSALRLLGPALGPKRAESLRMELSWIATLLGGVRDLDVFIANLETQAVRLGESGRIALLLKAELLARRSPAREVLAAALDGKRYEALLRRIQALADSPPPRSARGLAAQRVQDAAPGFIKRARRRVVKQGRTAVQEQDPAALHRLRILFKRLRYASEFFDPALGGRLEPMIKAMVKFQDCLGEHQDAVVAGRKIEALAQEMAARGDLPVESLLDLGALIQIQRETARERRERLAGLWRAFDRASVRKCLGETTRADPS